MLHYALVFFLIAIVAAIFGFGGISVASAGIAKILFFCFPGGVSGDSGHGCGSPRVSCEHAKRSNDLLTRRESSAGFFLLSSDRNLRSTVNYAVQASTKVLLSQSLSKLLLWHDTC